MAHLGHGTPSPNLPVSPVNPLTLPVPPSPIIASQYNKPS